MNSPYIHISGENYNPEIEERYNNWYNHVYVPELLMKFEGVTERRRYKLLEGNDGYPQYLVVGYYYSEYSERPMWKFVESRERRIFDTDRDHEFAGKFEVLWNAYYEVVKYVNREIPSAAGDPGADRPVMYIESYKMPLGEQGKYVNWLSSFGYNAYLPVLMRSSGLKEYDHYMVMNVDRGTTVPIKYPDNPPYVSFFYFGNVDDYQQFKSSPELAVFRERIQSGFQGEVRWSVGYQLVKSWRK